MARIDGDFFLHGVYFVGKSLVFFLLHRLDFKESYAESPLGFIIISTRRYTHISFVLLLLNGKYNYSLNSTVNSTTIFKKRLSIL